MRNYFVTTVFDRFKNGLCRGVLFAMLVLTTIGCATAQRFVAKDKPFPTRIAVLPFTNETNDITAPDLVRKVVLEEIAYHGYDLVDGVQTLEVLKSTYGITEGGHLGKREFKRWKSGNLKGFKGIAVRGKEAQEDMI